jgi:hypothetical protein
MAHRESSRVGFGGFRGDCSSRVGFENEYLQNRERAVCQTRACHAIFASSLLFVCKCFEIFGGKFLPERLVRVLDFTAWGALFATVSVMLCNLTVRNASAIPIFLVPRVESGKCRSTRQYGRRLENSHCV